MEKKILVISLYIQVLCLLIMSPRLFSRRSSGFTLVELLTVVVIIGILATISAGVFSDHIEKSRVARGQAFEKQLKTKMLLSLDSYVAIWNFGGLNENGEIIDGSAQANHLPLPPEVSISNVEGYSAYGDKSALEFDGTGSGIQINGTTLIPKDQITISLWFKLNRHKSFNQLYRYIDSRILIRIDNQEKLCFNIGTGGNRTDTCMEESVELDKWYHVAGTYDGQNMVLYVNGVIEDTAELVGYNLNPTNGTSMFLGRGDALPSSVLDGFLDNVYVWGEAFVFE